MNIDAFFSEPLSEAFAMNGEESDWLDVGTVTIQSSHISVGDAILFPGDQSEIEIDNGPYMIQAKGIDYGNDRRISRLRACQIPVTIQSKRRNAISVVFARVGICDPTLFLRALEANTNGGKDLDLYNAVYSDLLNAMYGVITLDDQNMVFVSSGWGSGQYDVYELWLSGHSVGFEITFINIDEE